MNLLGNFTYRPEINGLRAIAVLAVVFYHASLGCPGGYVGVDVFFVISGFLISTLIWKDLENGTFTFANFWERRFRRILPALVTVVLASVLAGLCLMLPSDLVSLGHAVTSQSLFLANIHYWLDTGYFVGAAEEKPLLHTWSLAVEEQFYFIAPVCFFLVFHWKPLHSRKVLLGLLMTTFLLSLGLSEGALARFPGATFYLLPTRAWELLLGAITAFLPFPIRLGRSPWLQNLVHLAGITLILVPIFFYSSQTPFPGFNALPPTLGTALLLWTNNGAPHRTWLSGFLDMPVMIFLGLISYSFYLWHWPFLAFAKYFSTDPLSTSSRVGLVSAALVLSVLSWKYVETPFRSRALAGTSRAIWITTGSALSAMLLIGGLLMAFHGLPSRFTPRMLAFAQAASDTGPTYDLTPELVASGQVPRIGSPAPSAQESVLVWGDSHAMATITAFDGFLKNHHLAGRVVTHSATAPILGWHFRTKDGLNERSEALGVAMEKFALDHKIANIVIAGCWGWYLKQDSDPSVLKSALIATIRRLESQGFHVWLLLDVPSFPFNIPKVISLRKSGFLYALEHSTKPEEQNELTTHDPAFQATVESTGARVLDPKPAFLDESRSHYIFLRNDVILYRDGGHLTSAGSKCVIEPFLEQNFQPIKN